MIRLHDPGLDPEATRHLNRYQQEVDEAPDYPIQVAKAKCLFSRRNTRSNPTFRKVRETLALMCSGAQRCAYCEDSVGDEVEHIQPKDLYPCLVFVWTNYVYACGRCNVAKSNKFAVVTDQSRLVDVTRKRSDPVAPPASGAPAFLNPRTDDPLDFLDLDLESTFVVLARDDIPEIDRERAEFTIETLKLNRDVLLEARANAFGTYRARLYEYVGKREQATKQDLLDDLKTTPHPGVWAAMKRQHAFIPDLDELFMQAPEALNW